MRFYRPLGRISALTFDLDDTLYDNRPVIQRTEQEALTFVQNYHPALRSFQNEDLQRLRQAVREAEPEIYHDVTRWRFRSIEQAMLDAGLSAEEASAGAHAAMILHVGDDLTTDVGGAIRSGMQACWIRPENGDLMQTWDSRLLPHLEISRLASLTSLI